MSSLSASSAPSVASSAPSVVVQDVSVTYRTTFDRRPTLRGMVRSMGRGEKVIKEVEAVKHVSFEIPHGTVLGIVGANGAGKSTLMRAIAGILPPNAGRIEVDGRVSTLLALGVGFNNNLSGRENVMLGGLASGLSRAEVEAALRGDRQLRRVGRFPDLPMKTYSAGMYGRLAFAVAVHMEPDILLIDEALSAGDARFRRKSARKMRQLCKEARTIVLVSHALGTVRELCDQAIWMDRGVMRMWDEPGAVVDAYTEFLEVDQDAVTLEDV